MARIAIICALEAEVRPLIKRPEWQECKALGAYRSFESPQALLVCAGIGSKAARRAAEAVIAAERPRMIVSAGFAGALVPGHLGGEVLVPTTIVSAVTGVRWAQFRPFSANPAEGSSGPTLVSADRIARKAGKAELAERFQAQAVDMEAATVAEVAAEHGIDFCAIKAISDEFDLALPDLGRFVDERGRFHTVRFMLHVALRPGLWIPVSRLASNQARASTTLCRQLLRLVETGAAAVLI